MRGILSLTLLLLICRCASPAKIHNQTHVFIDIEAKLEDVWIGCSDTDLAEENSLMTFYALAAGMTHEFMFRRVSDVPWCLDLQKKYRSLAEGVHTVRLVGIQPMTKLKGVITKRIPNKFKTAKETINWTFIRMSTSKGCMSYFKGDCRPENYWGGIVPPKGSD